MTNQSQSSQLSGYQAKLAAIDKNRVISNVGYRFRAGINLKGVDKLMLKGPASLFFGFGKSSKSVIRYLTFAGYTFS